ncbi:hypothetical protein C8Q77DRAFT_686464 [Trametes polyzona]|nr:hypothetical protein C8Q77DRAFT_686464 [Trametes polyzona]
MDKCPLPVEVCEAIMDSISDGQSLYSYASDDQVVQFTLCACALTCRAWRTHAQQLLHDYPVLETTSSLSAFIATLRHLPMPYTPSAIVINSASMQGPIDLGRTGELFMNTLVTPQTFILCCVEVVLPAKVSRLRLPFFDRLTTLRLAACTFDNPRALLDLAWTCQQLLTLYVNQVSFRHPVDANQGNVSDLLSRLSTARKHRKGCQELSWLTCTANWIHSNVTTRCHCRCLCQHAVSHSNTSILVSGMMPTLATPWGHCVELSRCSLASRCTSTKI